jgi:hypothetical protein
MRLLRPRPGFDLLENPASVLWAYPDIDIIMVDLTAPQTEESGPDILDRSLFSLGDQEFMTHIFTRFVGLSRVKHLALAFNLIHDNGGALSIALQAAFPDLQTLTVFPNSQMHVSARNQHKLWGEEEDCRTHSLETVDLSIFQALAGINSQHQTFHLENATRNSVQNDIDR